MSGKIKVERVITRLLSAGASMRCSELKTLLESLDFVVKAGGKGGHKLYFHDGIEHFFSGSYNCDHGRNPEIKRPYINKVIKVLKMYKLELIELIELNKESKK